MGKIPSFGSISYRTTKHATTKVTLFQLMYGRDPSGINELQESTMHDPTSYKRYLRNKLAVLRDFVEGHKAEVQSQQRGTMMIDLI